MNNVATELSDACRPPVLW